jgi:two-component system, chemotaxis family, chemotaxis protein CheY
LRAVTACYGEAVETKPTILVVEDDHDIRDAVTDLLRSHDYEVLQAEHGEEALRLLERNPHVRAIVLDVVMPVMNGATFRGEQLAKPELAQIPLILLTGRDDSSPLARALGAAACLQKPFAGEDLLRIVERYR